MREYCDRHPDWQELRKTWMVAFTGHAPRTDHHAGTQVPCPADYNRPPNAGNDHRRWAGNVATSAEPVNETAASRMLYGGDWYSADELRAKEAKAPARRPWWRRLLR